MQFAISFPEQLSDTALNGRLLIMLSDNNEAEHRFQITDGPEIQLIFRRDVNQVQVGEEAYISDTVLSYPLQSTRDIPAGDYEVQALLHTYETCQLSTCHTVQLPMDQGEGQQ